jgi:hypothetical protein
MFTLTISDKPIAVTNADEDEARDLFMSDDFKQDLKTLESEGAPLWDGFATLSIRPASGSEIAEFEATAEDEEEAAGVEDDAPLIIFLVEVSDPDEADEV